MHVAVGHIVEEQMREHSLGQTSRPLLSHTEVDQGLLKTNLDCETGPCSKLFLLEDFSLPQTMWTHNTHSRYACNRLYFYDACSQISPGILHQNKQDC